MSIRLEIQAPDDSGKKYTTTIDVEGENMTYEPDVYRGRYSRNSWYSNTINPNHHRSSREPTIKAIKQWVNNYLGWGKKGRPSFSGFLKIKTANIHCLKHGNKYLIQGMVTTKDIATTAISRTIYRSCFEEDGKKLEEYCFNNILLPENVSYALENRAPYHWYLKGKKVEVRFNTRMIGPDECAMEISDGIWAPINIKKMNTYMNYYLHGKKSSSWFKARLTPRKLWVRLLKSEPTEAQLSMMIAFLQQNRTDALVQERAYKLVKDMSVTYKDRMRVFWDGETVKAILIRGKIADWLVTDNKYKSEIQAVSTYLFDMSDKNSRRGGLVFEDGVLKGPICIDNMTKHSSVGDQFAARAFALLNDEMTVQIVSTINHYLSDNHYAGQTETRLHFPNVDKKDIDRFTDVSN